MGKLVLAMAMALSVVAAQAQEPNCADPMTQLEINQCAAQDLQVADAALNQAYHALMGTLAPADRTLLKAAQRAWISYRDAQCAFATAGTATGSIHPTMVAQCLTALTAQQTVQLERILHCEEGDLSCAGH